MNNIGFAIKATVLGLPLVFITLGLLILATKISRNFCPAPKDTSRSEEKTEKSKEDKREGLAIVSALRTFRNMGRDIKEGSEVKLDVNGKGKNLTVKNLGEDKLSVVYDDHNLEVDFPGRKEKKNSGMNRGATSEKVELRSPMPGKIIEVSTKEGEEVQREQKLFVLEAMKMENSIQAPENGTVTSIRVEEGDKVEEGQLLAVVGG